MKVIPLSLPNDYTNVFCATNAGYVLSKKNETQSNKDIHDLVLCFVDKDLKALHEITIANFNRIESRITINPNDPTMVVKYLEGGPIFFIDGQGTTIHHLEGQYVATVFDNDHRLYTAIRVDENTIELQLYDDKFLKIASLTIEDVLYNSYIDLEWNNELKRTFLSLAGGQDGCIYYTIDFENQQIELRSFLSDSAFVEMNDDNTRFLSINPYEHTVNYYTYPQRDIVSSFDYYANFDDGAIDFIAVHLIANRYLVGFSNRLYIYDAATATVVEELVIEGHQAKPTYVYYPRLKNDHELITDIITAYKFGDMIVFTTITNTCFFIKKKVLAI